jgi:cell wall-associated NlpC family hydrolase
VTVRTRFTQTALEQLGKPVLWAQRGPDVFDCSGLVAWALEQVGAAKTLRADHNAQRFHNESRAVLEAEALPGDLLFFGNSPGDVEHVAIALKGGMALSADGATSHITTLAEARKNPHNRVAIHMSYRLRPDLPYFAVHRNAWVDALDLICL